MMSCIIQAQEDCTNGVDDDNDGLIDLWDTECFCVQSNGTLYFSDFETFDCCPWRYTIPSAPGGIDCLLGMSSATEATSDYFNLCNYIGASSPPNPPLVPFPIPSGDGVVGTITTNDYVEYIGTCLPIELIGGFEYEFSMQVGFHSNTGYMSGSPFVVAIYGTTDCINYPVMNDDCLNTNLDWFQIGTMTVVGNNGEWSYVSGTFTVPFNTAAIAFGGDCTSSSPVTDYHFFDDFMIVGPGNPQMEVDEISAEGDCASGIELSTNQLPGAEYQWYLNGIAIAGATESTYQIPPGGEGEYKVMTLSNGLCGISLPYAVDIDENVLNWEESISHILCFGDNNGSIDLQLPGNHAPYQVNWSNGQTGATLEGLAPGQYSATVTDSYGCFGVREYDISSPAVLDVFINYIIQPGGSQNTGEVGISIAGGTPGYTIEWSNGANGYNETNLTPGHYTITVTDENGCQDLLEFDISAPFQSQLSFQSPTCSSCSGSITIEVFGGVNPVEVVITNLETGASAITNMMGNLCPGNYVYSITDGIGNSVHDTLDLSIGAFPTIQLDSINAGICPGDTTGLISVAVSGGTPAYQYQWSNGDSTALIKKLLPGAYSLTVTDKEGCIDTVKYQLDTLKPVLTNIVTMSAGCTNGGGATAIPLQSNGPVKWLWSTGDTTAMINDIGAGQYTVVVTDSLGCRKQDTVMVIQQGGIQTSFETSNAHCEQVADGYINLYPISFNGSVTYEWSNGSTEEDIDSLKAGVYSVTMTDEIGCRLVQEYTISTEAPYQVSADITSNRCNSDSLAEITLNITGGSNYQYSWSEGSISSMITGLKEGSYLVTVTDAYGCEQSYSYFITDPPLLALEVDFTPLNCAGKAEGEISLTATGGTGMYTYILNGTETGPNISGLDAGVFNLTVRDENGCTETSAVVLNALSNTSIATQTTEAPCGESVGSVIDITASGGIAPYDYKWSNGNTTEDLRDVPPGIYEVTITDKLGCEISDTIQLTNSDGPQLMISGEDVDCNGESSGQLMISAQLGSPPYNIYVNGVLVTGSEIKDLSAGIYEVAVVDAKGCEIKTNYEITEPPAIAGLIVDVVQPDINKITGSASLEARGGTGPYTIEWDNGEKGENALTLSPGLHKVTITDSSGCTAEVEVTIVKSTIYAIWDKQDNACASDCKGEIVITIQNEDGSEKIDWSDGGTGFIRTGLCAGDYQWTITDGYGNNITSPVVTIKAPEPIKLEVEVKGESCENKGDGQATISINGGTPNYIIKWDGVPGTEIANLNTGAHLIEIADANGCLTDTLVFLPGVISANINTEVKDAICETGGELTVQTSASEIIDVLINGIKYSIDKELTIRPLPPTIYKIEQQISDSCIVYKEEVTIERETFITGGNIQSDIEVKEGEEISLDISSLMIAGSYSIQWEGVQRDNCEQTDAFGNCLKYVYVPDGPHEVSAYILSDQGCDSLITFNIRVLVDNDVFFPNVFGVGNNNVFKPTDKTGKTKIESFEIYDRWGNLVYLERAVEISCLTRLGRYHQWQ